MAHEETVFDRQWNLEEVSQDLALFTTSEAKTHARIDTSAEDSYVDDLVKEATDMAQRYTNRQFLTATYKRHMMKFPGRSDLPIILPRPPLQSVSSIEYTDTDGNTQTWGSSNYQVDDTKEPGLVMAEPDASYPDVQDDRFKGVTIKYDAGYGTASDVPDLIKAAVKRIIAYLYDNRQGITVGVGFAAQTPIPESAMNLLDKYRVRHPR